MARTLIFVLAFAALFTSASYIGARAQGLGEIRAFTEQAQRLYEQGDHAKAVATARKALKLAERTLGKEHPDTIASTVVLAFLYDAEGRYGEAEPLYKRALEASDHTQGKEHPDTLVIVNNLADLYKTLGRFGESEQLYGRALEARERLQGKEHPDTLIVVNNLAALYKQQGRYGEAEPLYKRVTETAERVLGADDPQTLVSLNNLSQLYDAQGRYAEAEPLLKRVLEAAERTLGKDHLNTLTSVNNLALLYAGQGRNAEAEPLYKRAWEGSERTLGKEHPFTLATLVNLAAVYKNQARFSEAEPLLKRALEDFVRTVGQEHQYTIACVLQLAGLYSVQGRYGEAEPLFRRAQEASERVYGKEHPYTLNCLGDLARLYAAQGRKEAEPLLKRVQESRKRVLGEEHPDTLASINELAEFYGEQDRHDEAKPLLKSVLAARERVLGRDHPNTLNTVNNLALAHAAQSRFREAEPLFKRVLEARERLLGKDHPATLNSVNNLASLHHAQGHYGEAERLYARALAARERVLGKDHPEVGATLSNLAYVYFAQGDWGRATEFWRRSVAVLLRRAQHGMQEPGQGLTGKKKSEIEQKSFRFADLIKAAGRLASEGRAAGGLGDEMFRNAQWALASEAARSLAQMAARGAEGDQSLAVLARERQDLTTEWQKLEASRNDAISEEPERRDARAEADALARLAAIDARIAAIDRRLAADFPNYAALASPAPLSIEEARAQLRDDETLVLFFDTPEETNVAAETFVWAVTKTSMRWVRADGFDQSSLSAEVEALRCGLDDGNWDDPAGWPEKTATEKLHKQEQAARLKRCQKLTGVTEPREDALPFDLARAHRLYQALFGHIEDLIKDKHLLIVPSGPLTLIPFHTLITEQPGAPDANAYRTAAWMARKNAVTILPAVSSLQALRKYARASHASKALIGFGNPALGGAGGRAASQQTCPKSLWRNQIALRSANRGLTRAAPGAAESIAAIVRRQPPLPETADELCAVAHDLGVPESELRLGPRMTKSEIKRLSASGELASYRIVHFATHGATAGQLRDGVEAGLIMSPPEAPGDSDDADNGYLTVSEIAELKLDADWVILSACNTAAGEAEASQALSGLARAFFYAQARALLVSHWAVYSDSTAKLITGTVKELSANPKLGRAEALRRSMLKLIDGGQLREAHPAFWAPFVVAGEGGTAKKIKP